MSFVTVAGINEGCIYVIHHCLGPEPFLGKSMKFCLGLLYVEVILYR